MRPLAIDLFCGLGGWTEGLLAEGYRVVGFDIEQHRYRSVVRASSDTKLPGNNGGAGAVRWSERPIQRLKDAVDGCEMGEAWVEYPAQLVLQDVLTLDGAQFRDAALIVASPPCQAYSYRAMPWSRAKALPPPDNTLFETCFRIQREACAAAGRFIPLVVENVRGAQPYVGRARWHHGSFYLWGDVPALMPIVRTVAKVGGIDFSGYGTPGYRGVAFNGTAEARLRTQYGGSFGWDGSPMRSGTSKGRARKAASAHIAKIPLPLSRHIARAWHPETA